MMKGGLWWKLFILCLVHNSMVYKHLSLAYPSGTLNPFHMEQNMRVTFGSNPDRIRITPFTRAG